MNGNPVVKYNLDGISPGMFAVDEKTFTLYGIIESGEPENHLVMYRLNGLQ